MNWSLVRFRFKQGMPGAAWSLLGLLAFGLLMCGAYTAFGADHDLTELMPGSTDMIRAMLGERGVLTWDVAAYLAMSWRHPLILVVLGGTAAAYGSSLVAREVGDRTVDLLFSRPMSRSRILWHDLLVASCLLLLLSMVFSLSLWALATVMGMDPPGVGRFSHAGLMTLSFTLSILALSAIIGSLMSDGRRAMAVAGALLVAMYMVDVVGALWDSLEVIKPLSLFTYFTPLDSLAGRPDAGPNTAVMLAVTVAGVALSHMVTARRDL